MYLITLLSLLIPAIDHDLRNSFTVAIACGRRPFYRSALENIRRYVERDLRRLDRPPSILCACKPRDDPLESILYLTSVGVPSAEPRRRKRWEIEWKLMGNGSKYPCFGLDLG